MPSNSDKSDKAAKKPATKVAKSPKAPTAAKAPVVPVLRPVDAADLQRVVEGRHHDPHSILGPHPHTGAVTIRTLRPWASSVVVVARTPDGDLRVPLEHEHGGIFAGLVAVTTCLTTASRWPTAASPP